MPHDANEAWRTLGEQLAAYRKAAGFTQESLAAHDLIHYGRSTIANVERGRQLIGREFWRTCDLVLRTGGNLVQEYDAITEAITSQRIKSASGTGWSRGAHVLAYSRGTVMEPAQPAGPSHYAGGAGIVSLDADYHLWVPPGKALHGVAIAADLHPAVYGEQVVTQVPGAYAESPFLTRSGRALVVGQVERLDTAVFVMDSRSARRRLRGAGRDARLLIPHAYLLDDITLALIWVSTAAESGPPAGVRKRTPSDG